MLQIYEDEKQLWMQQEAARQAVEDEAIKYMDLHEEEWDFIAADVAQRKKEARPAGNDDVTHLTFERQGSAQCCYPPL